MTRRWHMRAERLPEWTSTTQHAPYHGMEDTCQCVWFQKQNFSSRSEQKIQPALRKRRAPERWELVRTVFLPDGRWQLPWAPSMARYLPPSSIFPRKSAATAGPVCPTQPASAHVAETAAPTNRARPECKEGAQRGPHGVSTLLQCQVPQHALHWALASGGSCPAAPGGTSRKTMTNDKSATTHLQLTLSSSVTSSPSSS